MSHNTFRRSLAATEPRHSAKSLLIPTCVVDHA
jgi:hypothetical protein